VQAIVGNIDEDRVGVCVITGGINVGSRAMVWKEIPDTWMRLEMV
jgi:hypothetical protein